MSGRTFTVRGRGEFPRDMMRYDGCTFASPEDEAAAGGGYMQGQREVALVLGEGLRFSNRPTVARWESFGWAVVAGAERVVGMRKQRPAPADDTAITADDVTRVREAADAYPSLYDRSGRVTDINTLLVPRDELWALILAAKQPPPQFPTALRKMWSGSEVQDWINRNWKKQ